MNKPTQVNLNEQSKELNTLFQKIKSASSSAELNEIEREISAIKKLISKNLTSDDHTRKAIFKEQHDLITSALETRQKEINVVEQKAAQDKKNQARYIALRYEIEGLLDIFARYIVDKKHGELASRAVVEILNNPHARIKISEKIFPAVTAHLKKLHSLYRELITLEQEIKKSLASSKPFDNSLNYSKRLAIGKQVTYFPLMWMILNRDLSIDALAEEGTQEKIKQLNEFTQGINPNLSDEFLRALFPTAKNSDIKKLMVERNRQILLNKINSPTLQKILHDNPTTISITDGMPQKINALYEQFIKNEINIITFRKEFANATANKKKEQDGHVLTVAEIDMLTSSIAKSARKDGGLVVLIKEIEKNSPTIKMFFDEEINKIPASRNFPWQKNKSKNSFEDLSVYSPPISERNNNNNDDVIIQKVKLFRELTKIHFDLKDNKDLLPKNELEKMNGVMREAKSSLIKFVKKYVDYLVAESQRIEHNIRALEKQWGHLPETEHKGLQTILQGQQTRINQLQIYVISLQAAFPNALSLAEHEALTKVLMDTYHKIDNLEIKLQQQAGKLSLLVAEKIAPPKAVKLEEEKKFDQPTAVADQAVRTESPVYRN